MRYMLDTEFEERGGAGRMEIQMISLALVAQDGRELYLENSEYDWDRPGIDPWLLENVRPHMRGGEYALSPAEAQARVAAFFQGDPEVQIWAYFGAYDWVVLCSLFGRMIDLPEGMPKHCMDLKQAMVQAGINKKSLPKQAANEHDALADSWQNHRVYGFLAEQGAVPA